jgi:hypothetical protein
MVVDQEDQERLERERLEKIKLKNQKKMQRAYVE